jgi:acyl-CoA thioesterase-1
MNWLVFHIVSGHSFFTGVALIVTAALASTRSRPLFKRFADLFFLLGIIAIVVSSTAIPYWYYAIATAATFGWIASRFKTQWRHWATLAVVSVWLVAALIELPYHVTRSLRPVSTRSITVIGDSITAGIGGAERLETWPSILARTHQLRVQDISQVGETTGSALKQAKANQIESPIVVVEIGGNDLLGTTTSTQFGRDLDALLAKLAAPDRQIILFELPLPPFCHEYGRVQRSVAAKHHVTLVPKRVFLSVIAGSDSTLDSLHLSQSGHQLMADCVWRLVKTAFDPTIVP